MGEFPSVENTTRASFSQDTIKERWTNVGLLKTLDAGPEPERVLKLPSPETLNPELIDVA
jgi:hypothetical protein